jgi:glycosyltransferase involved in cell wall biosynthesis
MTQDLQIILISPDAHYPSHAWPNTVALMRALRRKGQNVRAVIFSTGTEPVPPDLQGSVEPVLIRTSLIWRRISSDKWQGHRFVRLATACESTLCLVKALRLARGHTNTVLHFLGGFPWPVFLAVPWFRRVRFVYSLYGSILTGPTNAVTAISRHYLRKILQRAVDTGRLAFVCENDLNRDRAVTVVGNHAHLIPYAIDDREELPSREDARRRLDLPLNEKIILFFGTHRREKDYYTALKGCLALPHPPLALFVGKVISSNDPRQVVADCHYPKARIVDEFVPEEMVKYYFAAADMAALPYAADCLVSGVIIQCCQHLRPMIVSAFLSRYQCGVSYTPGNSDSFAEAAGHLLSGDVNCRAGLEQARHDHSWTSAADQYIKLYSDSAA